MSLMETFGVPFELELRFDQQLEVLEFDLSEEETVISIYWLLRPSGHGTLE